MSKIFTLFVFCIFTLFVKAQTQTPAHTIQAFGTIDTADLKMTACDFEKDANAEVLFDEAVIAYDYDNIIMLRHKRIKIFNDNGKDEANIRIEYYGAHKDEVISDVEAETINLTNGSIEYTNIDKKLIYTEVTDKSRRAIIFTFPNVKPGSVIEFKYKWTTPYPYNYPDWVFQATIPTRYSQVDASFSSGYQFELKKKVYQPFCKDSTLLVGTKNNPQGTRRILALSDVKAYTVEPFMDFPEEYLQRILLKIHYRDRSWLSIGYDMLNDEDFGQQLTKEIGSQENIISKANEFKTTDEKIAYIFNAVKATMKWNKIDDWFTVDGVKKAWTKKTGNSTEINLVLHNLLKAAKIPTALVILCTRDNGTMDFSNPTTRDLDRTALYYQADSSKYYILDASNLYNSYNRVPLDLMGLKVFFIDPDKKSFNIITLKNGAAREVILLNGSIGPDGKLEGTTQISGSSYSREKYLKQYNDIGEKKYIEKVQDNSKGLTITSLKLENIENDTLPLIQDFEFKYNLTEPDGDYMYFSPNLFTGFETNPFLSETRVSNIDFGCLYNYSINGRYTLPPGYKVDALPKSVSMQMPDKGIAIKRFVAEQDGIIVIHYTVDFKRSLFTKDEYPGIRDFYKKMYEMLNEQIVLKKSLKTN